MNNQHLNQPVIVLHDGTELSPNEAEILADRPQKITVIEDAITLRNYFEGVIANIDAQLRVAETVDEEYDERWLRSATQAKLIKERKLTRVEDRLHQLDGSEPLRPRRADRQTIAESWARTEAARNQRAMANIEAAKIAAASRERMRQLQNTRERAFIECAQQMLPVMLYSQIWSKVDEKLGPPDTGLDPAEAAGK